MTLTPRCVVVIRFISQPRIVFICLLLRFCSYVDDVSKKKLITTAVMFSFSNRFILLTFLDATNFSLLVSINAVRRDANFMSCSRMRRWFQDDSVFLFLVRWFQPRSLFVLGTRILDQFSNAIERATRNSKIIFEKSNLLGKKGIGVLNPLVEFAQIRCVAKRKQMLCSLWKTIARITPIAFVFLET